MTDPWVVQIPDEFLKNPQTQFYFDYLGNVIRDLIRQVEDLEARVTTLEP
jgi:hypothetical protein